MDPVRKIELSVAEKTALTRMLAESARAKELFLQTGMAAHTANQQRDAAAQSLQNKEADVTGWLNEILKSNGVDPTSPGSGTWNFDIGKMELTRTDVPVTPAVPDASPIVPDASSGE